MTTALVKSNDIFSLDDIKDIGAIFVKSGFFKDSRDQAQAVVKILYGRELGFSPVVAMSSIHIVEGKPELSSHMLATLVKTSSRYDYTVTKWDAAECVIEFTQEGKPIGTSAFSMADAQRAGLVRPGGGWTKYPKAMLFARAVSQGVRTFCPDVSMGVPVYAPGEIKGEDYQPDSVQQQDAAPVDVVRLTREPKPEPEKPKATAAQPVASEPAPASSEYIDKGRQVALHRLAVELIDIEVGGISATKKQKEEHFRQWLEQEGYVRDGAGSTQVIPMADFEGVKARLADHAATIREMAADLVDE